MLFEETRSFGYAILSIIIALTTGGLFVSALSLG